MVTYFFFYFFCPPFDRNFLLFFVFLWKESKKIKNWKMKKFLKKVVNWDIFFSHCFENWNFLRKKSKQMKKENERVCFFLYLCIFFLVFLKILKKIFWENNERKNSFLFINKKKYKISPLKESAEAMAQVVKKKKFFFEMLIYRLFMQKRIFYFIIKKWKILFLKRRGGSIEWRKRQSINTGESRKE